MNLLDYIFLPDFDVQYISDSQQDFIETDETEVVASCNSSCFFYSYVNRHDYSNIYINIKREFFI